MTVIETHLDMYGFGIRFYEIGSWIPWIGCPGVSTLLCTQKNWNLFLCEDKSYSELVGVYLGFGLDSKLS
jgi:hypothetical protein